MELDRVIIVGAGPVGLTAAMLLAERGIPVLILEADAAISDDLRASTFHPPTLDMLAPFGLTAKLIEQGLICPTWQIRMHATGDKAVFDLSHISDFSDHPYRLQCEQAKLCRLLEDRFECGDRVEIQFGARVIGLSQNSDHAELKIERAESGDEEVFTARYVIGADGAGSFVRESLGLEFKGVTYPETTVLASTPFRFQDHFEGLSNVNYCWSEGGNFSLLRLKDFWRCSLYYDPGLTFEQATSDARIQNQLNEILANSDPYEIIDVRPYRVHQRLVDTYRVGRVMLAGDAAHINSPSGGMGMNGGIHDAFNLVEKLSEVWRGGGDALLDKYTRQRRPVAETAILQQADRNRKSMTQKDPNARARALADLQATAADPAKARDYLLQSSMIDGLGLAASIE
jgi:2-polyprenyl-6-methoxyphenol hydroxylase-like FAD-dependent oxidoreductase